MIRYDDLLPEFEKQTKDRESSWHLIETYIENGHLIKKYKAAHADCGSSHYTARPKRGKGVTE